MLRGCLLFIATSKRGLLGTEDEKVGARPAPILMILKQKLLRRALNLSSKEVLGRTAHLYDFLWTEIVMEVRQRFLG